MRLLLIDYLSPPGHKKFDSIHISALCDLNHELQLIGRTGQFNGIAKKGYIHVRSFPKWMFKPLPIKPLTERLKGIIRLIWLLLTVRTTDFDGVVFLSYDVLSLFVYRISGRVYLINHNNVSQINDSKIKLMLTRSLPSNYIHVALNQQMERRIKELLPSKDVVYIPHGYMVDDGKDRKPRYLLGDERFLFCPVNNNYNQDFVKKLLSSHLLQDFLSKNSIKIITKEKLLQGENNNQVLGIRGRFSEEEYRYLMRNAKAIILPYGENFKYRCSGIFFECVANDNVVISTAIPDMEIFANQAKIIFFYDELSLINSIKIIDDYKKMPKNCDELNPFEYWRSILS